MPTLKVPASAPAEMVRFWEEGEEKREQGGRKKMGKK